MNLAKGKEEKGKPVAAAKVECKRKQRKTALFYVQTSRVIELPTAGQSHERRSRRPAGFVRQGTDLTIVPKTQEDAKKHHAPSQDTKKRSMTNLWKVSMTCTIRSMVVTCQRLQEKKKKAKRAACSSEQNDIQKVTATESVRTRGVLFLRHHMGKERRYLEQLVVLKDRRDAVMMMAHEGLLSCHQGQRRTTDRVPYSVLLPGCTV